MTSKFNILIVDDTPENLRLLMGFLKNLDYKVRPAPSGRHALSVLKTEPIDLILLDIMMPEMNGYEVCRRLKTQPETQDIPVLFISSLNDTFDKVKAFEAGGVDYITKPFQIEEVLARVKTHITIRNLQKELESCNRELAKLANKDGLTQIANRRYFDTMLQHEWRRLTREQGYFSLIMIDIDYFKLFNDRYGHPAGDECLKQVARIFDSVSQRPADFAARYGGEEFAILLPNTDEQGAKRIAEKINEELQQQKIPHGGSKVSLFVTCSMGIVSIIPTQEFPVEQFVSLADKSLYKAKAQGRNQFVFHSE